MNRFTGVMCLEGGPLDHTHYEAYQELKGYIESARNMKIGDMSPTDVFKQLYEKIPDPKWR